MVQVLSLSSTESGVGHRPAVGTGTCSLQHWQRSTEELLLSGMTGGREPTGPSITFRVKADPTPAHLSSKGDSDAFAGLTLKTVSGCGVYTAEILKKATAHQVMVELVNARRVYLEQTALQLLDEGYTLEPPPGLKAPESAVALAVQSGNPLLAEKVIAASPPSPQEVNNLLALAQGAQSSANAGVDVEKIAAQAVDAASLEPNSLVEMVATAVNQGMPSIVK